MDGVIDIDKARELVGNAALWPHVRDFLWDFAPSIHESWIESLKPEGVNVGIASALNLKPSTSLPPRVKAWLLEQLGVKPFFHDFPQDDWSRLALLDGATLLEIAKWLGSLACAEELRRVTDGATVRELKSSLRGIYPEVFSFTAYFTGLDLAAKNAKDAKFPEGVVAAGLGLLFALSGASPAPVADRLRLKLPKKLCDLCVLCGENGRSAAGAAVKKLLKLRFQEAYSLCCS